MHRNEHYKYQKSRLITNPIDLCTSAILYVHIWMRDYTAHKIQYEDKDICIKLRYNLRYDSSGHALIERGLYKVDKSVLT